MYKGNVYQVGGRVVVAAVALLCDEGDLGQLLVEHAPAPWSQPHAGTMQCMAADKHA